MPRITAAERKRFHTILDASIDKLNSPKNCKKFHWSKADNNSLMDHLCKENNELLYALNYETDEEAIMEGYDNINLPMMIIDNL